MKKKFYIALAALLIMHASVGLAGVADTKHNLSSWGPSATYKSATETEVCKFCHTPHGSIVGTPLWNHENTVTTFSRFSSSTLVVGADNTYKYKDDIAGSSKLCMGCHDGVTALGALSLVTIGDISPSNYLITATDLRNKHPVSFEYKSGAGTLLNALEGSPKVGTYGLPDVDGAPANNTIINPFVAEKWRREGYRVECTICHDPHENRATDNILSLPFWVSSSIGSEDSHDSVCKACHSVAFQGYSFFGGYTSIP